MITAKMTTKMIDFYKGSLHDIEHFMKVLGYARLIGLSEGLDDHTQTILELTTIVHDISCPLCREKYGHADGKKQEEESEELLHPFLEEFALAKADEDRIVYLVTHHHTVTGVDGIDYQILLEADFLVNASEGSMNREQIRYFYDNIVRTESGRKLLESIYLR